MTRLMRGSVLSSKCQQVCSSRNTSRGFTGSPPALRRAVQDVGQAVITADAPVETASCPGGFLVREDDSVPLFYSLDTGLYKKSSDPASPLARLRPALYEKYASYLGR